MKIYSTLNELVAENPNVNPSYIAVLNLEELRSIQTEYEQFIKSGLHTYFKLLDTLERIMDVDERAKELMLTDMGFIIDLSSLLKLVDNYGRYATRLTGLSTATLAEGISKNIGDMGTLQDAKIVLFGTTNGVNEAVYWELVEEDEGAQTCLYTLRLPDIGHYLDRYKSFLVTAPKWNWILEQERSTHRSLNESLCYIVGNKLFALAENALESRANVIFAETQLRKLLELL